jgi:trimethylamine:corrinoid methyltransferase-like protein
VGSGGHFLAEEHTRQHIGERWIPELTHPRPSSGHNPSADIRRRARAKLNKILAEHEPVPLEPMVQAELRAILDAAEKHVGV